MREQEILQKRFEQRLGEVMERINFYNVHVLIPSKIKTVPE